MTKIVKDEVTGCWYWANANGNRYPTFSLNYKPIYVYRASYMLFKGEINKGDRVAHTCGDKLCVNPDHLELRHAVVVQDNAITTPLSKSTLDYIDYINTTTHIDKDVIIDKLIDFVQSYHADNEVIRFLQN